MNIILNDSGNNLGGVETFLNDLARLLAPEHKIFFIVNDNKSYYERENDKNLFGFIYKKRSSSIEFLSNRDIIAERDFIKSQLDMSLDYYVISFYFYSFQYALAIFAEQSNIKLLHFWSHPLSWIRSLHLFGRSRFIVSKSSINKKKFDYMRGLLSELNKRNADYCGKSYDTLNFNNWFFGTNFALNPYSFPFPTLSKCTDLKKSRDFHNSNHLKLIWVGRFVWFKNKSIEYIIKSLEYLSIQYPGVILEFALVGYGSKHVEQSIKKIIDDSIIKINLIGRVEYSQLPNLFKDFDIGIGMGLTIKNMADCSLPSILIDSLNFVDINSSSCNWIYDSDLDDAGDGIYQKILGLGNEKKTLINLITPIVEKRIDLIDISKKSKDFYERYYSMQNNLDNFYNLLAKSTFHGTDYKIYRRPILMWIIYSIVKTLIGRNKTSFLRLVYRINSFFN